MVLKLGSTSLVIVIDNLDNCPVEVQRLALRYVNDLRKNHNIEVYRIIIPLWPTTFDTFSETTEVLTLNKPRISLGPPTDREFIEKRLDVIKQHVVAESKVSIEEPTGVSFDDLATFESFVDFVFASLQNERIGELIRDLCNDDLRRELWLWEGIFRSGAAEHIYNVHLGDKSRRFGYEWIEALVAGDLRTRVNGRPRVANLFSVHHDNVSPRDILAGYYGCQLLHRGERRTSWYASMMRLGYNESLLGDLVHSFRRYNLLHPVPEQFKGEEFEVHVRCVGAYLTLFSHPAYVDNMAMITPVDEEVSKVIRNYGQTTGHNPSDLEHRAKSSTRFIEFVSNQELLFVERFRSLTHDDRHASLRELQWLDSKHLSSASHVLAAAYQERIDGLVRTGFLKRSQWVSECHDRLQFVKDRFSRGRLI